MDVCARLFCVCLVPCIGRRLAKGWSPAQEVLPTVNGIKKLKSDQGPTKGCRAIKAKGKAIPVIGREDPQGCETSRLPHFLDSQLTDGGEFVSLTRRPPYNPPRENSWYSFVLEAESTTGP
jgi:hypothetical protein